MDYTLQREKRKTLMMKILPDGTLLVKAPLHLPEQAVVQFVEQHKEWAQRQLAQALERKKQREAFQYLDGQAVPYLGRLLPLATGTAAVLPDRILLPAKGRPEALAALYKKEALRYLSARTAFFAGRFGFSYASVSVGSAKTVWGTCDGKNRIRYSFRVMALPEAAADYIVVHELCHTLHKNHGAAFWQAVDAILPEHRRLRAMCREWERRILF